MATFRTGAAAWAIQQLGELSGTTVQDVADSVIGTTFGPEPIGMSADRALSLRSFSFPDSVFEQGGAVDIPLVGVPIDEVELFILSSIGQMVLTISTEE